MRRLVSVRFEALKGYAHAADNPALDSNKFPVNGVKQYMQRKTQHSRENGRCLTEFFDGQLVNNDYAVAISRL